MTFDILILFRGLVCFFVLNTVDMYYMYSSSNCNYFAIASAGFFPFWLVSPFRERNNFIWLS